MRFTFPSFSPWLAAFVAACSAGGTNNTGVGSGDQGGTSGTVSVGTGGNGNTGAVVNPNGGTGSVGATGGTAPMDDPDVRMPACSSACADLASSGPLLDTGLTSAVEGMFGGSASGAGPCVLEPGNNTLVPYNW